MRTREGHGFHAENVHLVQPSRDLVQFAGPEHRVGGPGIGGERGAVEAERIPVEPEVMGLPAQFDRIRAARVVDEDLDLLGLASRRF
ncbi:hypothetical protein AB0C21_05345 [Spirillospora sp. NPDC049024]